MSTVRFQWEIYKELNKDLQKTLTTSIDYERHFILIGKRSGRKWNVYQEYPDFNYCTYRDNYEDLKDKTKEELENHWILFGRKNGRIYKCFEKLIFLDKIDKIYWINMNISEDRRKYMLELLNKLNIPNERFCGKYGEEYNSIINISNDILKSKNGVYGCLLSHLELIKKIYYEDVELALVLEDDISIEFLPYWKKRISDIIKEAPIDWEILSIAQTIIHNVELDIYTPYFKECFSTMAYIINKKGCANIMKLFDEKRKYWNLPNIEHTAEKILYGYTKMYLYKYPYFTYSDNNKSLIHDDHKNLHDIAKINSLNNLKTSIN